MERTKVIRLAVSLLAIGGLGYIAYYFYSKSKLKSGNPDKDNRKILFTRTDI